MRDSIRPLVLIAGVEALAGLAVLTAVIVSVVDGGLQGVSGVAANLAAVEVATWVIITAALSAIWWGLLRRRRLARTPFVLAQLFVLVLLPLFWGSDLLAYRVVAVVAAVLAVAGIVLALRPATRAALT